MTWGMLDADLPLATTHLKPAKPEPKRTSYNGAVPDGGEACALAGTAFRYHRRQADGANVVKTNEGMR